MRKKRSNIRPELIGELFLRPGEDIPYRLTNCETEPQAIMESVVAVDNASPLRWPISEFEDFVLLVPKMPRVRKLKLPVVRKPRSDKGGQHKRTVTGEEVTMSEETK